MKKLLLIWELPYSDKKLALYKGLIESCNTYFTEILSPIDTLNFEGTWEERYKRAFDSVKNSDVIIAECSNPSSGQWMEIRESVLLWKELIVIAEKWAKVSGLITASPNLKKIIYYQGIDNLTTELKKYFLI